MQKWYDDTKRDSRCWRVTSGHKCCRWRQADSLLTADSWAEDNYRDQHLQSAGAVTERGFTSYYNGDTAMVIGCIYMATLAPHVNEYLQGQDSALDNKDTRRSEEIMNPFATECPQCPLDVDRFLAAVFDVLMMSRDGDNWEHSGNYQGHNKLGHTRTFPIYKSITSYKW